MPVNGNGCLQVVRKHQSGIEGLCSVSTHSPTMTIPPQEHQSLSIEFGPIGRGGRTKTHSPSDLTNARLPRTTVAMPTVTLPTHRNSRNAAHSQHGTNYNNNSSSSGSCCSMARLSRWTFLGLVIFYANELSSSFPFFRPTVRSTPHVRGDYSSIRGVHDLKSSRIRPKCFVSVCLAVFSVLCSVPFCRLSSTDCSPYPCCRAEFPIAHVQTHSLPKKEDRRYGWKLMR